MTPKLPRSSSPTDSIDSLVSSPLEEGELLLRVAGIVPAADFHPFIVRTARRHGLRGWVRQEDSEVLIRVVGSELELVRLIRAIRRDAPVSARVRSLELEAPTADTPAIGEGFVVLIEEQTAVVAA